MKSFIKQAEGNCTVYPRNSNQLQMRNSFTSRRNFLYGAATAASGLALTLGGADKVFAAKKESAEIVLDALLVTYFGASVGATDVPSWSLKGEYSNTVGLKLMEFPDLRLSPRLTQPDNRIIAGHGVWQTRSSQMSKGLIMQHRGFGNTTFSIGQEGVAHTYDDSVFFCIFRPRLRVTAASNGVRFAFTDGENQQSGGAMMFTSITEIKNGSLFDLISEETLNSWLPHYVTDREALAKPRFKLRRETGSLSAGVSVPINVVADGDRAFSRAKTATSMARIIEQKGFESEELKQMFAVGNHLEVTHASVQEIEAEDVVRMRTTLTRAIGGSNEIYWDSLFKTFLIIDV
jgi:hypothetical protein